MFQKALAIFSWVDSKAISIGDLVFPTWTEILGNLLSATNFIGIFGWAIYEIYKTATTTKNFRKLVQPDSAWRPLLDENLRKVQDAYRRNRLAYHISE
jgi:hypothetical protein